MTDYQALLQQYQSQEASWYQPPTLLEVTGFHRRELLCSRLVAFYLNPQNDHGLGDLLLRALFAVLGEPLPKLPGKISVDCEVHAEDAGRLDILVDTPQFLLLIENKIFHAEVNDFAGYRRWLKDTTTAGRRMHAVLLCLRAEPPQNRITKDDFKRVTYQQLWQQVRQEPAYLQAPATKWKIYLEEFMETTARLDASTSLPKSFQDFLIENKDVLQRLLNDTQKADNEQLRMIGEIKTSLESNTPACEGCQPDFHIYKSKTLVTNFKLSQWTFSLDLNAELAGWYILFLCYDSRGNGIVEQVAQRPQIRELCPDIKPDSDRFIFKRWDIKATKEEVESVFRQSIQLVSRALMEYNKT